MGQIPETALHENTALHLDPTPMGGSTTPRRTLGTPIYGLGPTNGRIGPWGWVAKMGVLQEISGEMGQIPETAPHEATSLHLAPTPHPTPRGGSTTPRRTLGTPIYGLGPTDGLIGPWGWVAKIGVLQQISRKMGQIGAKYPKLRYTRPPHSTSPPSPTPPRGVVPPPPDARWGAAFMG